MNRPIFIIGGGISLKGFDFSKLVHKTTIVVNKSIFYVPNPNYFITIDYSFLEYLKRKDRLKNFKQIKANKIFIANFAYDYVKIIDGIITDTRFDLKYHLDDFDQVIPSNKFDGFGYNEMDFRSGNNSGYCALQYAIIKQFNPIYLLGFDLTVEPDTRYHNGETHFHKGYGRNKKRFQELLIQYQNYFIKALQQHQKEAPHIKVYSCSPISTLNRVIEYKNPKEIL